MSGTLGGKVYGCMDLHTVIHSVHIFMGDIMRRRFGAAKTGSKGI